MGCFADDAMVLLGDLERPWTRARMSVEQCSVWRCCAVKDSELSRGADGGPVQNESESIWEGPCLFLRGQHATFGLHERRVECPL